MASASGVVLLALVKVPLLLAPVMVLVLVLLVPVLVQVPGLLLVPAELGVGSHLLGLRKDLGT